MAVVVTWVPMHLLLGVGRGQVDLLGMRIVRHMRLGHHRIAAGAWRLWAEWLLHAGHVLLLLLFLQGAREGYSSTALPPKESDYVSNGLICQALDLSGDSPHCRPPTSLWGLCDWTVPKRGMNSNGTSMVEDRHGSAPRGSASTSYLYRAALPGFSLKWSTQHNMPHQAMVGTARTKCPVLLCKRRDFTWKRRQTQPGLFRC